MADYNSSLPVRTESSGDVAVKVVDGTITSQQLAVDSGGRVTTRVSDGTDLLAINADGSVNITDNGGSLTVDATNLDIRDLTDASDKVAIGDGTDTLAVNGDGSINSVVTATNLDIRDLTDASDKVAIGDGTDTLAINADGSLNITDNGGSLTVDAVNLDIRDLTHASDSVKVGDGTDFLAVNTDGSIAVNVRDATGTAFSATNPLPVTLTATSPGTEINNYSTAAALAAAGTSNHDYTVSGGVTLQLTQVEASASGKMKIEVQIETAAASGVFNTRFVQFNSNSTTNMSIHMSQPISVATGVRVRVIRTNRDNQALDVFSTISGNEA